MIALVKTARGTGNMQIMDVPAPICGHDEVLVEVSTVGVCGTDYSIYKGEYDITPPLIPGHEFCGRVVEMGKGVSTHSIGDRVVVEICFYSCGVCKLCKAGFNNICLSRRGPGTHINGAMAEYINVPAKLAHKINAEITDDIAALAEPLAVAVHGMCEKTTVNPEDIVVIYGAGPIGLICVALAKLYGASKVMLVGLDTDEKIRLPLGKEFGADYIVNSNKTDIVKEVLNITSGLGADLVVECSGAHSAINSGINALRKAGSMSVIGLPERDELSIEWKKAVIKSINVLFSYSSTPSTWNKVLSIINRKAFLLEKLITNKEPLANWEYIFGEIAKGNVIKALMTVK